MANPPDPSKDKGWLKRQSEKVERYKSLTWLVVLLVPLNLLWFLLLPDSSQSAD